MGSGFLNDHAMSVNRSFLRRFNVGRESIDSGQDVSFVQSRVAGCVNRANSMSLANTGLGTQCGLGATLSIRSYDTGFWTLYSPQAVLAYWIAPVAFVSL